MSYCLWGLNIQCKTYSMKSTFQQILIFPKLKKHDVLGEKLWELEAAAKSYTKKVGQTSRDMGIEKARKNLKNNELEAVSFDKGVGFCVMKKHREEQKLTQIIESEQFERNDNIIGSIIQKIEK